MVLVVGGFQPPQPFVALAQRDMYLGHVEGRTAFGRLIHAPEELPRRRDAPGFGISDSKVCLEDCVTGTTRNDSPNTGIGSP
jgi:hypothetical protein